MVVSAQFKDKSDLRFRIDGDNLKLSKMHIDKTRFTRFTNLLLSFISSSLF
jgi:hypothetical protein